MSAHRPHPRIDTLDRLAVIGPDEGEQEILSVLIEFLLAIDETTIARAAHAARERTDA